MGHDVFISHSSKDKEIVHLICSTLENSGLKCWIAPRNIKGGDDYAEEIIEAIRTCTVMLLVFSNHSNESAHVKREIDVATNAGKTIIPFKITDTEVSLAFVYYLAGIHWIDGTPAPTLHIDKLAEQIALSIPKHSDNLLEQLNNLLDKFIEKAEQEIPSFPYYQIQNLRRKFNVIFSKQNIDDKPEKNGTIKNNGYYDIFQNSSGEVLIIINARQGTPNNAKIFYDGGSNMLLYRNQKSAVILSNIAEKARPILKTTDKALIAEITSDEEVYCEYKVPIHIVKNLDILLNE